MKTKVLNPVLALLVLATGLPAAEPQPLKTPMADSQVRETNKMFMKIIEDLTPAAVVQLTKPALIQQTQARIAHHQQQLTYLEGKIIDWEEQIRISRHGIQDAADQAKRFSDQRKLTKTPEEQNKLSRLALTYREISQKHAADLEEFESSFKKYKGSILALQEAIATAKLELLAASSLPNVPSAAILTESEQRIEQAKEDAARSAAAARYLLENYLRQPARPSDAPALPPQNGDRPAKAPADPAKPVKMSFQPAQPSIFPGLPVPQPVTPQAQTKPAPRVHKQLDTLEQVIENLVEIQKDLDREQNE